MSHLADPISNLPPFPAAMLGEPSRWYAVYTCPRHEKTVAERLEHKGIEVFLPTVVTESRWKDRTARIESPLFPGYVFTRIRLVERGKVLTVPGVVRMLSCHGAPASIDDAELEAVRLCVERGVRLEVRPFLEVGERVRVRSGVLEGLEGVITRCKDARSLIVPVSLIHQSVAVEVDAGLLESLGASTATKCESRSGFVHGEMKRGLHRANA